MDLHKENLLNLHWASQRFHEYRKVVTRKAGQKLSVFFKECNVYDSYALALARKTRATVAGKEVVGHLPREISRFVKLFCVYGGERSTSMGDPKYHLEIPISLTVRKGDAPDKVSRC